MLTDLLGPYKYVAIAVACVAVFGVGYKVSSWKWQSEIADERIATADKNMKMMITARQRENVQRDLDRQTVSNHQVKIATLDKRITELKRQSKEKTDAAYKPQGQDAYPFTNQFVLDFDGMSNSTSINPGSMPGASTDTKGTTEENSGVAKVTRSDLIDLHGDQMSMCLGWKQQVDDIDEWDSKTYKDKK